MFSGLLFVHLLVCLFSVHLSILYWVFVWKRKKSNNLLLPVYKNITSNLIDRVLFLKLFGVRYFNMNKAQIMATSSLLNDTFSYFFQSHMFPTDYSRSYDFILYKLEVNIYSKGQSLELQIYLWPWFHRARMSNQKSSCTKYV